MADRHGLVALADELNSSSISNATRDMLVRTGLWNREGLNSLWDSLQQNPLLLDLYPSIKSGIDYALRQAKRDAEALAAKAAAKAGREASVNGAWRSLAPAKGTKGDILKGIFDANRGAFTKVEKVKASDGPAADFSAYGDEAERTQNFGNEARAISLEIARNGKGAESAAADRSRTVSTVMMPGTPEFNATMADLLNDALDSARTFYSAGVAKASVKGVKGLDAAVLNTLVDVPSLLHSKKRLDATDVELMLDPDSARINGDAVLNGDKPLC